MHVAPLSHHDLVRQLIAALAWAVIAAPCAMAAPPSAEVLPATGLTGDTAVLNGRTNPGGLVTTARFRWTTNGPTCGAGSNEVFADQSPIAAGNTDVLLTARITGLTRSATYTVCLITSNASSSAQAIGTFVSPNTPAVTTNAPLQLSATLATWSGTADPRGTATTAWFRYGTTSPGAACNDSFGTRVPISGGAALGSGSTPQSWSQPVTGLTRATTYYLCAIAQNSAGISFGDIYTLTTPYPALDIDQNGVIDANTDGLLVLRYLLGLRGAALVAGALGAGALRTDAAAIEAHVGGLTE